MNYVTNHCRRLSRRCTILATSLLMLAMMRIEILKSKDWVHRYRRASTIKVILHQFTSPLLYHPCECEPPSPKISISQVSPAMEWRSPPVPSDRGHKIRTKIDKGSKVHSTLLPTMPESVSPARRKNRHLAASSIMAVHNKAKYDPIGAGDKQQED